jgi:hypothetical protein
MIGIFVYDEQYLPDHVLFGACRIDQVVLGLVPGDVPAAPDFELGILADMKHVLEYFEVAKIAMQNLKAPEGHGVEMQSIQKRDILNLGEVGEDPLVEDGAFVITATARVVFTHDIECRNKIVMLIAGLKVLNEQG